MNDSNQSTPLLEKKNVEYKTMSQHLSSIPSALTPPLQVKVISSTPNPSDIESASEKDEPIRNGMSGYSGTDNPSAGYSSMDDRASDNDILYQSDEDLTTGGNLN